MSHQGWLIVSEGFSIMKREPTCSESLAVTTVAGLVWYV
jgi:hypothetical protein